MRLDSIDRLEAARYMGVKGTPDDKVMQLICDAEKKLLESVQPKYVYREAELFFSPEGIFVSGIDVPFTGNSINNHLKNCNRAVLLAATLTSEADKLIRRAVISSTAEALAMDCVCSAAVERVCNMAEGEIFSGKHADYRTWRFSPGYGDLPITLQKPLLTYLNAQRRIGLTVSDSFMLVPTKSVTAIIGISDKPVHKGEHNCSECEMRESCAFSKINKV